MSLVANLAANIIFSPVLYYAPRANMISFVALLIGSLIFQPADIRHLDTNQRSFPRSEI